MDTDPTTQVFELADVDRNGDPDIVAINKTDKQVQISLNDGNCSFRDPGAFTYGLDGTPNAITVAHLVNNKASNILDIVVGTDSGTVTVLLGVGDGNFDQATGGPISLGGSDPVALAVADFDSNGTQDIAVLTDDDTIVVLSGDGNGGFQVFSGSPFSTGGDTGINIAAGDFDGDQNMDLIVLSQDSDDLRFFKGHGDANVPMFDDPTPFTISQGEDAVDLAVGFINNDTKPDAVVIRNESLSGQAAVLLGSVRGLTLVSSETDTEINSLSGALGDIDGDSLNDIVSTSMVGSLPEVNFGNGDGTFSDPFNTQVSGVGPPRGIAIRVADLDSMEEGQQGRQTLNDIVFLSEDGSSLIPLINISDQPTPTRGPNDATPTLPAGPTPTPRPTAILTPSATPTQPTATPTPTATNTPIPPAPFGTCVVTPVAVGGFVPVAVAAAPIDGNKSPDIIAADGGSQARVIVFPIDETGIANQSCGQVVQTPIVIQVTDVGTVAAVAADKLVNGDSAYDIAVGGTGGITILQGNGSGGFPSRTHVPLSINVSRLTTADVDGDGHVDLVAVSDAASSVTILYGADFTQTSTVSGIMQPTGAAVFDLQGDGDRADDLAVASGSGQTVNLYVQNPVRTFSFTRQVRLLGRPTSFIAGDIDSNGTTDLLATLATNELAVAMGSSTSGGLTFSLQTPLDTGDGPQAVGVATFDRSDNVADFNADMRTDLVVANATDDTLDFYLGAGGGTFNQLVPLSVGHKPIALAVADFDLDGRKDVVTANNGDGSLTLLRSSFPPPTPTPPPTDTPTLTPTAPPSPTPSATPTWTPVPPTPTQSFTPVPTATLRGTKTPTATATNTPKGGTFVLSGTGCAIANARAGGWDNLLGILLPALSLMLWRRR